MMTGGVGEGSLESLGCLGFLGRGQCLAKSGFVADDACVQEKPWRIMESRQRIFDGMENLNA